MIIKEISDTRKSVPGAVFKHEFRESNVDAHKLEKNSLDIVRVCKPKQCIESGVFLSIKE